MHLTQSDCPGLDRFRHTIIIVLVLAQPILLGYLLAMRLSVTLSLTLLCGMPIAAISSFLLTHSVKLRYARVSVVMFAAGGFGMLLGYIADLGQVGLYGLLSICYAAPSSMSDIGLGALWQKIQLTPWSFLGMFVGGNLGMLFLDDLRPGGLLTLRNLLYTYVICNIGMLSGMLLGEAISGALMVYLNPFLAAVMMVILMLLGMTLGMLLLMNIANRLSKYTLLPVLVGYHGR